MVRTVAPCARFVCVRDRDPAGPMTLAVPECRARVQSQIENCWLLAEIQRVTIGSMNGLGLAIQQEQRTRHTWNCYLDVYLWLASGYGRLVRFYIESVYENGKKGSIGHPGPP